MAQRTYSLMQFMVPFMQVRHHRTLYLDQLPRAVSLKYSDTSGFTQLEKELFIDTSVEWELGELRIVGYVSLFHLWEKYSKAFLSGLFGCPRSAWPPVPRKTYPQTVAIHLEKFGFKVPEDILRVIEEANTVVNCWKHGEEAAEKLREKHPEYLGPKGEEWSFHVPQEKLDALFDSAERFWNTLRDQAPIDFCCA